MANVPIEISIKSQYGYDVLPFVVNNTEFKTDINGIVVVTFKLNETLGRLKLTITTKDPRFKIEEQAQLFHTLFPFDKHEENFVIISNKKQIFFEAGDRFQSSIAYSGHINQFLVIISSKGSILSNEISNLNEINFLITNKMTPSVRILVLGIVENAPVVADSLHIYVKQKDCSVKIDMDNKIYRPGSSIFFQLNGKPNDVIAFSAIDQSLNILKNRKIYEKFEQNLKNSDLGKDDGNGMNSLDIIHNNGFKILDINRAQIRRSITKRNTYINECKKYENHYCCQLAMLKSASKKSCEERKSVVEFYSRKETNCAYIYFVCCTCLRPDDRLLASSNVKTIQNYF